MGFDASSRIVLLLHDGELADLRALAVKIGAQVIERRGLAGDEPAWDVACSTPRYVRELAAHPGQPKSTRIAVLDRDARTLRSLLRRAGVELVVRRPVHPSALRLLLLHALYRGPERRSRRVAVGTPVRFRAGLFRYNTAVLADLSMRGCLLLSKDAVAVGRRIVVYLPDALAPGRAFAVAGQVVRTVPAPDKDPAGGGLGVAFARSAGPEAKRLTAAVAAYAEGPAALAAAGAGEPVPDEPETGESVEAAVAPGFASLADSGGLYKSGSVTREVVRVPASYAAAPAPPEAAEPPVDDSWERRRAPRRAIAGRRVVALGGEAARVLIGRDLSAGGMRIDPTPSLVLGQRFRIALHASQGETPLVVQAEVARDDGPRGMVLRFCDLTAAAERYLAKLVDSLPVLETCSSSAERVVVSEILDLDGG